MYRYKSSSLEIFSSEAPALAIQSSSAKHTLTKVEIRIPSGLSMHNSGGSGLGCLSLERNSEKNLMLCG